MLATRIMMALVWNVRDLQLIVRGTSSRRYTKDWLHPPCFTPSEETMETYLPRRPPIKWDIFV